MLIICGDVFGCLFYFRHSIAQTIVKSSAVAGKANPRQYIINDSIYKHSELICKKERDILLELIDDIKNK